MSIPVRSIDDLEALWGLWAAAEAEALAAKSAYLAALDYVELDGLDNGGERGGRLVETKESQGAAFRSHAD